MQLAGIVICPITHTYGTAQRYVHNIAFTCEYLSSKWHRSIKFRVPICSKDTQSCKLISTRKLECTILHVRTYILYVIILVADTDRRVATQLIKCEL